MTMTIEDDVPSRGVVADARGRPPGKRRSVLIVDDQADERAIQRAMLEHRGYRVAEAADGEAALETAREMQPDLVLLDIAMPRMDGLAVCRELRKDSRTADAVVLFYTASPAGELEERVREAGGNGVLIKPVDPQEVAKRVESLIGPPPA
jgi:two-component system, OmpR family, alkaline phosphatase synthesis response regulator PhoP